MGKSLSHDVPRPQDDSRRCLSRLANGEFHALVDLAEALEREGDPRARIVNKLIEGAMRRIVQWPDPATVASGTVAEWQRLSVACLRLMHEPEVARQAERAAFILRRRR